MKTAIVVSTSVVLCVIGYLFFRRPEQRTKDRTKVRGVSHNAWQSIKRYCVNVMRTSEDTDVSASAR